MKHLHWLLVPAAGLLMLLAACYLPAFDADISTSVRTLAWFELAKTLGPFQGDFENSTLLEFYPDPVQTPSRGFLIRIRNQNKSVLGIDQSSAGDSYAWLPEQWVNLPSYTGIYSGWVCAVLPGIEYTTFHELNMVKFDFESPNPSASPRRVPDSDLDVYTFRVYKDSTSRMLDQSTYNLTRLAASQLGLTQYNPGSMSTPPPASDAWFAITAVGFQSDPGTGAVGMTLLARNAVTTIPSVHELAVLPTQPVTTPTIYNLVLLPTPGRNLGTSALPLGTASPALDLAGSVGPGFFFYGGSGITSTASMSGSGTTKTFQYQINPSPSPPSVQSNSAALRILRRLSTGDFLASDGSSYVVLDSSLIERNRFALSGLVFTHEIMVDGQATSYFSRCLLGKQSNSWDEQLSVRIYRIPTIRLRDVD